MSHLKATVESLLTLEADDLRSLRWLMDAACAMHHDMKGHTGAGLTLGKGSVHGESAKQKINDKSSAEIEQWISTKSIIVLSNQIKLGLDPN